MDSPCRPRASDELIAEPVGAPELEAQWAASMLWYWCVQRAVRVEMLLPSVQSVLGLFECYGLKFSHLPLDHFNSFCMVQLTNDFFKLAKLTLDDTLDHLSRAS